MKQYNSASGGIDHDVLPNFRQQRSWCKPMNSGFEIIPNWHPIFVNFTVALVSLSALCYFIGYFTQKYSMGRELLTVGRWCLWLSALFTIATISAGFVAYYSVVHDAPSHEVMNDHRNWAIATFIIILAASVWSAWIYFKKKTVPLFFVLFLAVPFLLVSITAWHGAELVFRHGVGVKTLLKARHLDHQHSH